MALIEDLVKEIPDSRLRTQITTELAKLKARKRFGLVFEEHLPEIVQLPNLPPTPGGRIVKKSNPKSAVYKVLEVLGPTKIAVVPERGGQTEILLKDDVTVIKQFGEPMFPALVEVDKICRAAGKPYHALINADNFHALQLMLYCYEGKVDVIYIDPPYNTGARDWKYNNDYVDKTDTFRHSKWLSMMKKRLLLASNLLKPDGVMVVTIDDYEAHHLRTLIDHEIPGLSVIGVVAIKTSPSGRPTLRGFRTNHEYALFVASDDAVVGTLPRSESQIALFKETDDDGSFMWSNLRKRGGANTLRLARPKQFYPIYVSAEQKVRVPAMDWDKEKRSWMVHEKPKRDEETLLPYGDDGKERIWSLGHETLQRSLDEIRITQDKQGKTVIQRKVRASEEGSQPSTFWDKPQYSIVEHGTVLLERILGIAQAFPFPKSVYAVADCLRVAGAASENALIVDFFAGSGTTLHATAMLNAEDSGNRQCILVTNNEVSDRTALELTEGGCQPGDLKWEAAGICEAVTWPRVRACISGKRPDGKAIPNNYLSGRPMAKGFAENVVYYRMDFLDPVAVSRRESYQAILPILWLLAKATGDLNAKTITKNHHFPKDADFCVLFEENTFPEFLALYRKERDRTYVFLVTDSVESFNEMRTHFEPDEICIQLYKSYLDNFKINLEPRYAD